MFIAILIISLIAILAFPNLRKEYGTNKINAFTKKINDLVDATENMSDNDLTINRTPGLYCSSEDLFDKVSISSNNQVVYNSCSKLDLKWNGEDLRYVVVVDNDGKITGLALSNGDYCYSEKNPIIPVALEEYSIGTLTCNNSFCGCPNGDGFNINYSFNDDKDL